MYSFLKMKYAPDLITEEQIAGLECEYDLQIPDLLRDFYKKYNGIPIHRVTFYANGHHYAVTQFISLFNGFMSAEHILDIYRPSGRIPQGFLPLAVSDYGDDYFLDTKTGAIYLISLDQPHRPKRLLNSLDQFFSLLERSFCQQNGLPYEGAQVCFLHPGEANPGISSELADIWFE